MATLIGALILSISRGLALNKGHLSVRKKLHANAGRRFVEVVDLVLITLLPGDALLGEYSAPQGFQDAAMVLAIGGFLQLLNCGSCDWITRC
jgi:hypothetical protein